MIRITSKQAGFRRCGVAHLAAPTDHADDAFTPAQLKQLQAEPMLLVEIVSSQGGELKTSLNVAQTVELVAAAATVEELNKLAEGETRKGVLDAITKRRAELAPAE